MRSFVIGDLVYVKLEVCVVPLLGEILEMQDNGLCKLRMCGYSPLEAHTAIYTGIDRQYAAIRGCAQEVGER